MNIFLYLFIALAYVASLVISVQKIHQASYWKGSALFLLAGPLCFIFYGILIWTIGAQSAVNKVSILAPLGFLLSYTGIGITILNVVYESLKKK